jgi:outer membrane lipase/esterase
MLNTSRKSRIAAMAMAIGLNLAGLAWAVPAAGAADTATAAFQGELFVFGDSLSDSGNAYALSGGLLPPSPPYAERFSNGPVWTEHLAEILHLDVDLATSLLDDPLANNQAVAGAFTDERNSNSSIPSLAGTGILGQVSHFAAAGGRFRPRDVIVVWGGANNYIFDEFPSVPGAIGDLVAAVEELAVLGGRRFVVPNMPDLGRTPLVLGLGEPYPSILTGVTEQHNAALAAAMSEVAREDRLKILVLDIHAAFDDLLDNPFILPNKAYPCIGEDLEPTHACDGGTENQAVFWDPLHPTTVAHNILAHFAAGAITSRPVFNRFSVVTVMR